MADVTTDRDLAVQVLLIKAKNYKILWDYYEGRQPLVYSYDRMREIFSNLNARFTQNWCAVVVDATNDKIQLQRITVADNKQATDDLGKLLNSTQLVLESGDVHLAALVTGESYIIGWPDEETGEPQAYYNDPCNVHLFYEADKPRQKRFAAKWWVGDDDHRYLTLYYPDRLEYYRSTNAVRTYSDGVYAPKEVSSGKEFSTWQANGVNPYGVIPVFHFRREHRTVCSELQNIIEPQDAINKLLADMMIAAEFGAFPQRYVISQAGTAQLKNAPNMIWDIPAGDGEGQEVSAGQFDAAPLDNYLKAIDKWCTAIAIISRTPKHYFFGQGGDPSGESLIAQEAPLNRKAQKYIDHFTATWSEVGQFMALLGGLGDIDDNAIVPIFDKPQTVQPYTQALIRKESVAAGIPLMWIMKQEGYTEQELADLEAARSEEQAQQQASLAQAMTNAQRNFDQNGANNNAAAGSNPKPPQGTPNSA